MTSSPRKAAKNPLFGAAVVKAVLAKRAGDNQTKSALYEGILRDLGVSDEQVEEFLAGHRKEVEQAIRSHGRRGD